MRGLLDQLRFYLNLLAESGWWRDSEEQRKRVLNRLKGECLKLKETISPKYLRVCLAFSHTHVRSMKRAQVFPDYLLCLRPHT